MGGGWWVGGLLDYSVSPVQSFEIWSSTGLSLDNYASITFPCVFSEDKELS